MAMGLHVGVSVSKQGFERWNGQRKEERSRLPLSLNSDQEWDPLNWRRNEFERDFSSYEETYVHLKFNSLNGIKP